MNITCTVAGTADAATVARLHATSWRSAYAPFFTPEYLAGPIEEERLNLWTKKLSGQMGYAPWVLVAAAAGRPVGFVCVILDKDQQWGALLDNLHVVPEMKGRGIGKLLLNRAAEFVAGQRPGSPMHLWVFEKNVEARAFYERMGGEVVGSRDYTSPDGVHLISVRYVWRNL